MAPTMTPTDSVREGDAGAAPDRRPRMADATTPRPPSDEALVSSMRGGAEGAFELLVTRYQKRLFRFCLQILRSKEDAEDALQDVFASAYRAILADDRDIHLQPWLYQIARNRSINQLRRAAIVTSESIDAHMADHGPTLVEKVVGRQRLDELIGDVQALRDTQRTALVLYELDGLSYKQIALATNNTVSGVKSLLVRARSNLLGSAAARDSVLRIPRRDGTCTLTRPPAHRSSRPASNQTRRAATISTA
jgi:RNA polymerase sigma factor (sigma-70 family)